MPAHRILESIQDEDLDYLAQIFNGGLSDVDRPSGYYSFFIHHDKINLIIFLINGNYQKLTY